MGDGNIFARFKKTLRRINLPCDQMTVTKRDGSREPVQLDKILRRVQDLSNTLHVDCVRVAKRVVQGLHDGVTTRELDELAAQTAAGLASHHPDYAYLAARLALTSLYKRTTGSMVAVEAVLSDDALAFVRTHREALDAALVHDRDFRLDYFGFKTLERSYLVRDPVTDDVVERPQVLWMRVAVGIHCLGTLDEVLETYHGLSRGLFTHATPTLFNAGTRNPTLASCYLLPVIEDSISGIFETLKRCAEISKSAGGIGVSVTNVRSKGSRIASTGGKSNGLVPMLRTFEATARYVDQGGGKRKGAFAAYLEPWHPDVREFLDLRKNHGAEHLRARDLFYALWIPDLFMRRVEANESWTLFCPSTCTALLDSYGDAFDAEYERFERAGMGVDTMSAQELWFAILDAQIETGTPYMLYKDACNGKSNHNHLGTIRCSNLCTEIVQYSSHDEIAVCNLASLALPAFVENSGFDHERFAEAVRIVTRNLNRIIDRTAYVRNEAQTSNLRHRPIGIGVQGLADVFALLELPFESEAARTLNRAIFETLYFASLDASCALAERDGSHPSYEGSLVSQGRLQMDLWKVPVDEARWGPLRARIAKHGVRNSLLVAPMPTASTAQILGNNECFEPFTSNLYSRKVLAGEFAVVNKHLVRHLESLGLWTDAVRHSILAGNGSVQHVPDVPDTVKALFKTVWEMKMRSLIDLAADRAPFVDQSQSLNLFVAEPSHAKLTSMHFYAWRAGLKTGMYYLRTRPAVDAVKVTVPVEACRRTDAGCVSCSA